MIRPAKKNDKDAILSIAKHIKLFEPDELISLEEMFNAWLVGNFGEHSKWIVFTEADNVTGTAYYATEQFAHGTWNVYFIAVGPDKQRNGIGSALMRYIEESLTNQGERVLIVETSSLLKNARNFYLHQGYEQEACIREFYKAGDDKIVFRKLLIT